MMGEFSVRNAVPTDREAMLRIAQACAEAPQWSEAVWRDLFAREGGVPRAAFVAAMAAEVVGFVVASCAGEVAELESIAVLRETRRQGVGRALCLESMMWAMVKGALTMELEVRASSAGALALYDSLGFVEQGRRRAYYLEPVENSVLLSVPL
jgi:[ribosomal protein S18]-alanine N-acetyltransferase